MTVRDLIKGSLRLIGVIGSGETPSAADEADALSALNDMVSEWGTEGLLIFKTTRESFPLVAAQQAYTMGTGANFNTTRPNLIEAIAVVDGTSEIPLEIITAAQWSEVTDKSQTSNIPTTVYVEGTFPNETLNVWPTPSAVKNLIIYSLKPIVTFAAVGDTISLPPGYQKALRYNLAIELAPEYGNDPSAIVAMNAQESKANLKRANLKPAFMSSDLSAGKPFNILAGE